MIEHWKRERDKLRSQVKRYDRLIKEAKGEKDLRKNSGPPAKAEVTEKSKLEKAKKVLS